MNDRRCIGRHRAQEARDRIVPVMPRQGRAGGIVEFVLLGMEREGHVLAHEFEMPWLVQAMEVPLRPSEGGVGAARLVTGIEQPADQV